MRPSFVRALLLIVPLAVAASGCTTNSNPVIPTAPPEEVSEAFSGSVGQAGSSYHVINARSGVVTTSLDSLGPDPTTTIGLSIGVLNSLACTALMDNPTATVGSQLVGTSTGIVTLCIRVYDFGSITAADQTVNYSLTVKYFK